MLCQWNSHSLQARTSLAAYTQDGSRNGSMGAWEGWDSSSARKILCSRCAKQPRCRMELDTENAVNGKFNKFHKGQSLNLVHMEDIQRQQTACHFVQEFTNIALHRLRHVFTCTLDRQHQYASAIQGLRRLGANYVLDASAAEAVALLEGRRGFGSVRFVSVPRSLRFLDVWCFHRRCHWENQKTKSRRLPRLPRILHQVFYEVIYRICSQSAAKFALIWFLNSSMPGKAEFVERFKA